MPRLGLREFSTPDFRSSLPAYDPNNAIWPRISAFAKMLHDISWEDDGTKSPDQDELDAIAATESEQMKNYAPASQKASEQMEGYKPNTREQDVEAMVDEQQRRVNGNYTGGHREGSVDMERQKAMADRSNLAMDDFVRNFDPKKSSKEDIRKMQRIVAPADARLSDPDDTVSKGFFDDAVWGKASQQALEDYLKQWGYQQ